MIVTRTNMIPSWQTTVLDAAYRRGLLCPAAREKVVFLLEQGLHLEQALIGTGLSTMSQYADLIEACFHIRPERLDVDECTIRAVAEPLPHGVVAAETEEGEKIFLIADAWVDARASWRSKKERCLFVFFSDILRFVRSKTTKELAVSAWWRVWKEGVAHEVKVLIQEKRGEVWMGADGSRMDALRLDPNEVPAMQTWFEGGYPSQFWDVRRILGVESDILQVTRKTDVHPVARMELWRGFLKRPRGVLAVFAPDAWLLGVLETIPGLEIPHEAFQTTELRRIHPETQEGRELAMHAALAGALLCWVEMTPAEMSWTRDLASAGIPVTIVRRRETLHGSAWEAYHL